MNGKQLKNSILQWAIQGKLVPQDPNDEPASVLLEKIRQEKERLIKEKKIKRDKNASIIYRGEDNSYYEKMLATGEVKCIDEEIPFEIPKGWEWCRMGCIGDWGAGATPAKGNPDYYGGSILWLRTGELNNGIVYDSEIKITDKALQECSLRMNKIGDVLIAMYGATIGKVAIVGKELTTNQACCACTPFGIYNYYLFFFLMGSQIDFIKKGEGGAQPNISREKLISHLIPIPPLAEQHRIVEKIQYLLPLVEKYSNSQILQNKLNTEIKDKLRKSILQEAIQGKLVPQIAEEDTAQKLLEQIKTEKQKLVKEGKLKKSALNDSVIFRGDDNKYYEQIGSEVSEIELPFEIPSSWSLARLNAVCQLTDGLKAIGKQCLLDAKYLRGKSSGTIVEQGKLVYKGDNIVLVDGENSGEVFIVPQDGYMGSTFKQLWISSSMYEPYILAFIQFYKETLRNSKKGAAIPHLNKELFYGLIIGIPPFQEQKRIVQKIELSSQLLK
ncbi:restriction endonuclease subunit S [Segatella copri]|uniref:restriction endonuclease subunit S n=1 Tax=Segatella copri TaxID=165179 RepID=UPI001291F7FC|nr:restriction endonuclease subunit S [Segatella copri]MQN15431.1 restriction endonuclease subunit S [Segatella copri]